MTTPETARTAIESMLRDDRASQSLGIELREVLPGKVSVAMTVRPDMVNGLGVCHGGILFTFADSAFAFACNTYGDAMVAAGASIAFLAPCAEGEHLTAVAAEVQRTARGGIYDVRVSNGAGTAVALFRGRCARMRVANSNGTVP